MREQLAGEKTREMVVVGRDALDERSPLFYARVAGLIYLSAMALSIVSQVFILGRIVVPENVTATVGNIATHEGLFRLGIGIDIITSASDVAIGWALYELLKSVDRPLALLGAFFRIADATVLVVTTFDALMSLRLLSGADYLSAFQTNELQGLARLFVSARGFGFGVGFVFLGSDQPFLLPVVQVPLSSQNS